MLPDEFLPYIFFCVDDADGDGTYADDEYYYHVLVFTADSKY